jgi:hypothetical protein
LSFGSTSPVLITGGTPGTATLTVSTTAPTSGALAYPARPGVHWTFAGGVTLVGVLLLGVPARRRRLRTMLGLLVFLGILAAGFNRSGPITATLFSSGPLVVLTNAADES